MDTEVGDKVVQRHPPKIKPKRTNRMNDASHLWPSFQETAHSNLTEEAKHPRNVKVGCNLTIIHLGNSSADCLLKNVKKNARCVRQDPISRIQTTDKLLNRGFTVNR